MTRARPILLKAACAHWLVIVSIAQGQPTITSQPINQTVEAGYTATFAVTATGSPPLSYQWLFDDAPVSQATNTALTLYNVRSTDAGAYSVIVSNQNGSVVSDAATLTVLVFAPVITQQPHSQEVDAGRYPPLYVRVTGTQPISYQWFRNGDPVPGQTYNDFSSPMTPELAGNYSVLVSNEVGAVMSDTAIVTVRVYPPLISRQPTNVTVFEGQTAEFNVIADGAPYATYQWYFNDAPIGSAVGSSLTFRSALPANAGNYSVIVSNSEGSFVTTPVLLRVLPARTDAGSVDLTFSAGENFYSESILRLALQQDGKILAAGTFSSFDGTGRRACVRLQTNGDVDVSFNQNGLFDGNLQFLAELADGKILVNQFKGPMLRWNSDGTIDRTFSRSLNSAYSVLSAPPDGRIVIAASTQFSLSFFRLKDDGTLDFSFNSPRRFPVDANGSGGLDDVKFIGFPMTDGKILVGGDWNAFRMHVHGAYDDDFRAALSNGFLRVLSLKPDNSAFVAGTFTNISGAPRNGLALLNPDGSPNISFNPEVQPRGSIVAMAAQLDGKVLIAGTFTNIGSVPARSLARLNSDGSLDSSFEIGSGPYQGPISSIALQSDCKILVAGSFMSFDGYPHAKIVRLNSGSAKPPFITREPASQIITQGGQLVLSVEARSVPAAMFQWFGDDQLLLGATGSVLSLSNVSAALAGSYYVVLSNALGVVTSAVASVTVNPAPTIPGAVDPDSAVRDGADSTIRATARQSNGKLIVAGWLTQIHGVPSPGIARLNADDSLDTSFNVGTGPNNRIMSLALDPADRILVGGSFTNFNGQACRGLVRLNPNGDVDTTFQIGAGFSGGSPTAVNALALQPDGKILAGGSFFSFNNTNRINIARLLLNGALDASFVPHLGFDDVVLSLAVHPDGRIWVGHQNRLERLEPNGAITTPQSLEINGRVGSLLIQSDGNILVGGLFYFGSAFGQVPLYALTRVMSSGMLDTNFYNTLFGGVLGAGVQTLRRHTCGRILVGGYFMTDYINRTHYHVARLESNGTLDPVFGAKALDGTVYTIDVEPSTEVIIGGEFSMVDHARRNGLARLHAEPLGPPTIFAQPISQTVDGGREVLLSVVVTNCSDFTFQWQLNGTNIPGATNSSLLLPSARVPEAGNYRVVIRNGAYSSISEPARLQVNREQRHPGSIDVDFLAPRTWDGPVQALASDGKGNVLAGGAFTAIDGRLVKALARFDSKGELDPGFRMSSNTVGTVYSIAVQPDGNILAAGSFPQFSRFIYRLLPDGRFDTNFQNLPNPQGTALSVAALPDGKILVGGVLTAASFTASRSGIARLLANGVLDTNFAAGGVRYPLCFLRQKDGRIIIGGTFTNVGTIARNGLARLHPDGPLDMTFMPGEGANSPVTALALTRDEKILIGGNFTRVEGISRGGVARLNHDGSVDATFDPGLGVRSVWALAVQPDDKLIVGGSFTFADGLPRAGIARFNTDGAIDAGFDPGAGADGQVFAVLCDRAGKIYLGGNFTSYNAFPRDRLARANGDVFLMNPQLVGGTFQVSLFTFYGQSYALEFKTSLTDQDWTQASTFLGDGTIRNLTAPVPGGSAAWYRVSTEP